MATNEVDTTRERIAEAAGEIFAELGFVVVMVGDKLPCIVDQRVIAADSAELRMLIKPSHLPRHSVGRVIIVGIAPRED